MKQETKPTGNPNGNATLEAFAAAFNEYTRQLGQIWEGMATASAGAQQIWSESVASATSDAGDAQEAYNEALRAYVEAIRDSWETSQEKYQEAYAGYVEAHREAWARAEPAELSPQLMAAVARSADLAATYASSTIGNWSLVASTGVPPWLLSMAKSG